jgi:nitrogen fixation protein FixH
MNLNAENAADARKWNPWPVSIIAFFALALAGLAAFITFCVMHPTDLVMQDYYEQELRYQDQIDRTTRARALDALASVAYDQPTRRITIALPLAENGAKVSGNIHLYRPSEAALDRHVQLDLDARGTQVLDASDLRPGLWKVKVQWKRGDEEYYLDRQLKLDL